MIELLSVYEHKEVAANNPRYNENHVECICSHNFDEEMLLYDCGHIDYPNARSLSGESEFNTGDRCKGAFNIPERRGYCGYRESSKWEGCESRDRSEDLQDRGTDRAISPERGG